MTDDIDLENWACKPGNPPLPVALGYRMRLSTSDGFDEKRRISDCKPTPEQILETFGLRPAREYVLLVLEKHGVIELPMGKTINISDRRTERFFAFKTDRTYKVELNGDRFTWGASKISSKMLRLVGRIPDHHQLLLAKECEADIVLDDNAIIDLADEGLETISSREQKWELKVQGVLLTLNTPKILVREALVKAGLDPNEGWMAALKITGEPRQAIGLDGVIDLTRKGIEKLWLRPCNIQNGEASFKLRRDFDLGGRDSEYLQKRGIHYDALIQGVARWIILRNFPVPNGYTVSQVDIAVQIPATYPMAALDMFYCNPYLQLISGEIIPQTTNRQSVDGKSYQRWSRHRMGETTWNPSTDSLITHIAIIDEAFLREVE